MPGEDDRADEGPHDGGERDAGEAFAHRRGRQERDAGRREQERLGHREGRGDHDDGPGVPGGRASSAARSRGGAERGAGSRSPARPAAERDARRTPSCPPRGGRHGQGAGEGLQPVAHVLHARCRCRSPEWHEAVTVVRHRERQRARPGPSGGCRPGTPGRAWPRSASPPGSRSRRRPRRRDPMPRQVLPAHGDLQRAAAGRLLEGHGEPVLGEACRVQAVGQLLDGGEGGPGRRAGRGDGRGLDRRPVRDEGSQQPEVHGERDEVLLGAVVDVALDPSPALLRRQHESLPRRPQVAGPQLRLGDGRAQGVAQDRGLQDGRDVLGDVPEECAVPGGDADCRRAWRRGGGPAGSPDRASGVTWAVSLPSRTASAGQPAASGGVDVPAVVISTDAAPSPSCTSRAVLRSTSGRSSAATAPRARRASRSCGSTGRRRRSRLPSGSRVTAATAAASTVSAGPAPVDTSEEGPPGQDRREVEDRHVRGQQRGHDDVGAPRPPVPPHRVAHTPSLGGGRRAGHHPARRLSSRRWRRGR